MSAFSWMRPALAVASVILGMASVIGLPPEAPESGRHLFVAIDLSRSVAPDASKALARALDSVNPRDWREEDQVTLLGFGERAVVLAGPAPAGEFSSLARGAAARVATLPKGFGDQSALEPVEERLLATDHGPGTGDVLLISDFRFPRFAIERFRDRLAAHGIALHGRKAREPLPGEDADVRLEGPGSTSSLVAGTTTLIACRVVARGIDGRRHLRLQAPGQLIPVVLDPVGTTGVASAEINVPVAAEKGARDVSIQIADPGGEDADPRNNRIDLLVREPAHPSVLVFGRRRSEAAALFRLAGFEASTADSATGFDPRRAATLGAIVCADAAFADLAAGGERPAFVDHVLEGGLGLLILGGPHAFRRGGYAGTVLEDLSPLSSKPPRGRELAVLLDVSGSMEAEGRLSRAVESCSRLIAGLSDDDRVQVIPFADVARAAIPSVPVAPRAWTAGAGGSLWAERPSGGTRLDAGFASLPWKDDGRAAERERIVLVLSDFRDPELVDAALRGRIRERVRGAGASIVAVLLDPEEAVEAQVRDLGATVLAATKVTPDLLLDAVENDGWRVETLRGLKADPSLGGAVPSSVHAFNSVRRAEQGDVLLETEDGMPLLALGRRGRGKVAALAADPTVDQGLVPLMVALGNKILRAPEVFQWCAKPEGMFVEAPPGRTQVGARFLRFRDQRWNLDEVEPGIYRISGRGPTLPAGADLVVVDAEDRLLGTVPGGAAGDPEFAVPELPPPPAIAARPRDAGGRERRRGVLLVGWLVVLGASLLGRGWNRADRGPNAPPPRSF